MRYAIVEIIKEGLNGLPHVIHKKVDLAKTTIGEFHEMVKSYNNQGYEVNVVQYI